METALSTKTQLGNHLQISSQIKPLDQKSMNLRLDKSRHQGKQLIEKDMNRFKNLPEMSDLTH